MWKIQQWHEWRSEDCDIHKPRVWLRAGWFWNIFASLASRIFWRIYVTFRFWRCDTMTHIYWTLWLGEKSKENFTTSINVVFGVYLENQQMSTNRNFVLFAVLVHLVNKRSTSLAVFFFLFFCHIEKCQFRSKDIGFYECRFSLRLELQGPPTCFPSKLLASNLNFYYLHFCNANILALAIFNKFVSLLRCHGQ